ncbi:MAG: thymidylate synthase [Sulfitobacter sp.]|jgi:hypothetical protein|uniref:thymidylate synthase n=1 Tax=Sulfitobacter sp. TaxID=1903071 RepID=UPI0040581A0D
MKTGVSGFALCLGLAACGGGTPFNSVTVVNGGGNGTGGTAIPETLANNLKSFAYNPTAQTLTVTGINADDSQFTAAYRRRPGLDRAGYEAYTAQDGSLDRHVTAYVKDINGTRATVIVTGGQFEEFFSGAGYSSASYVAPVQPGTQGEGGLVTYAGNYVGLLNIEGSGEDLTSVTPGTPDDPLSVQAAEVTGKVVITGDFTDATVDGIIYQREIVDYKTDAPYSVPNIALDGTAIAEDGSFLGTASQRNTTVGEYGGIFGGVGATEVAGVVRAEQHLASPTDNLDPVIEYGAFVLAQCGQPNEDPICNQPVR